MNASEARKITDSYNRNKHRAYIIGQYNAIFSSIKKAAKKGESYISFAPTSYRYDNGLEIVFRLFRLKNPSYQISISEYNNRISIIIKW